MTARSPWYLLTIMLFFPACQSSKGDATTVAVRILDDLGRPTAARVRITDLTGQYYAPAGHRADFAVTSADDPVGVERDAMLDNDRRFAYVEGEWTIELPAAPVRVEVVKGFRYKIYDDTLDLSKTTGPVDIQLEKQADWPSGNWYDGDVHVHFINPETALLEMKAEDLNVCNVLISDFTIDHDRFRGDIEPLSEPGRLVYLGQEYREDRLGHVNLLNLKERLIEPSKARREHQYPLNSAAYDEVKRQQGHVSWAHFAAWPGLEGPLAAVLRKVDAVELLCTIDPFHEPIFVDDIVPEVRMNSGLRLWYRLLNCGLRIPITAGTDKMNNQVTVGANRVFARLDGELTYDAWIDALNAGRTFVSNTPFLLLSVDGQEPGSMINVSAGESYRVVAEVWSQLPIDRLELVANGELLAEKTAPPGESHARLEFDYRPRESAWIAARAYQFSRPDTRRGLSLAQRRDAGGGPTLLNQYFGTLRPETVFAHTSPVYLLLDGRPIRSASDAAYFAAYLDNALQWLADAGSFPTEAAKEEVLAAFREGKTAFEGLAGKD